MSVTMLDTIGATAHNIPRSTRKVAGYVTGSGDVPWSKQDWALFPYAHIRIDQAPGMGYPHGSDVADYEPGAKTLGDAMDWLRDRAPRGWWSTVYVGDRADLATIQGTVAEAKIARVQYWVCRPDLNATEAEALIDQVDGGIVAVQWATPASNPDMRVPLTGQGWTLKTGNIDVSVTADSWFSRSA